MKITDIFDIRLKYLVEALPSHGKLKLALFGNLKLACVNGTQKAAKHVGKPLATKKNCLYSRQLLQQLARVVQIVFDGVWAIGKSVNR